MSHNDLIRELKKQKTIIDGEIASLHFMRLAVSRKEVNKAAHIDMQMKAAEVELEVIYMMYNLLRWDVDAYSGKTYNELRAKAFETLQTSKNQDSTPEVKINHNWRNDV